MTSDDPLTRQEQLPHPEPKCEPKKEKQRVWNEGHHLSLVDKSQRTNFCHLYKSIKWIINPSPTPTTHGWVASSCRVSMETIYTHTKGSFTDSPKGLSLDCVGSQSTWRKPTDTRENIKHEVSSKQTECTMESPAERSFKLCQKPVCDHKWEG